MTVGHAKRANVLAATTAAKRAHHKVCGAFLSTRKWPRRSPLSELKTLEKCRAREGFAAACGTRLRAGKEKAPPKRGRSCTRLVQEALDYGAGGGSPSAAGRGARRSAMN
jgi:hypothetical protein